MPSDSRDPGPCPFQAARSAYVWRMTLLICALAALLLGVTLLPLSGTHHWWVRMWDFPRVQVALALGGLIVLVLILAPPFRWALAAGLALCLVPHLRRIRPFSPLARREMRFAPASVDGAEASFLAAIPMPETFKALEGVLMAATASQPPRRSTVLLVEDLENSFKHLLWSKEK